ncbi:MAG: hypothetical protein ACIAXF_10430 [Phycisphaerales bacterium JB063]
MQPPFCKDQSPEKVAARLRQSFELHRAGVRMMRAKLRQQHPDESDDQINSRLNEWLQSPLTREQYLRQGA